MSQTLVLSLFPGIGLLDRAFEDEWFCVVRGPDRLWGGDIRSFHPPTGVFDGLIGGPPCQAFSRLAIMVRHNGYEPHFGNLIPEFERCVAEARPAWFLMENVEAAPAPVVEDYVVRRVVWNNRYFGADLIGSEQNRRRAISFGTTDGRALIPDVALFEHQSIATGTPWFNPRGRQAVLGDTRTGTVRVGGSGKQKASFAVTARHAGRPPWVAAVAGGVTAGHGGANSEQYVYGLEDACELQGLPRDFCADMPFTKAAKLKAVANGVPLPMGRAIARAVKRAMDRPQPK